MALLFFPHSLVDLIYFFEQPEHLLVFFLVLGIDHVMLLRLIIRELNYFISDALTAFLQKGFSQSLLLQTVEEFLILLLIERTKDPSHR